MHIYSETLVLPVVLPSIEAANTDSACFDACNGLCLAYDKQWTAIHAFGGILGVSPLKFVCIYTSF